MLTAVASERVLIICDNEKIKVGEAFTNGALALGLWTRIITLRATKKPRTDIPKSLIGVFTRQRSDVYINLLRDLREETPFRIRIIREETRRSTSRLGHCPGVTIDMLTHGALALTPQQHEQMQNHAEKLIHALDGTIEVKISNPSGTNLTLNTENRKFFTDTKLDSTFMNWVNLPTGEVIVAPKEDSLNGRLVCDMAIGGIGQLETPLEVSAKNGRAEKLFSSDKNVSRKLRDTLETDDWSPIVGEFAFGINPRARFTNEFLEAEKILGTIHIAFGRNTDMPGGKNPSKNHVDLLVSKPTVEITKKGGAATAILEDGRFRI